MSYELKKKYKQTASSDFWYDVFDGGYLNPEDFLESEKDIELVNNAKAVLKMYRNTIDKEGVVDEL